MKNNELQKSVSLYLVIIIVSVLLAVSLNLATLIVGGAKILKGGASSVKPYYAADTGIEKALYNAKNLSCNNINNETMGGDPNYVYSVIISYTGSDCTVIGTTFQSTGEFKPEGVSSTKRKVTVSY